MNIKKISAEQLQKRKPSIAELREKKRTPVYVLFENIRSLYNVGAMLRTSDAALVSKVFLTGITGTPPHKEIDKAALGASDTVPWEYSHDARSIVEKLKAKGISIVALELTHESIPYQEMKFSFPVCLVVGNEVDGISDELLSLCDDAIDIPMLGRANSLNVATAYGVALYEMLRQYKT